MIRAIGPSPRSTSSSLAVTFKRLSKDRTTRTNQRKTKMTLTNNVNRYNLQTETSVTHTNERTASPFNRYTFDPHSANASPSQRSLFDCGHLPVKPDRRFDSHPGDIHQVHLYQGIAGMPLWLSKCTSSHI